MNRITTLDTLLPEYLDAYLIPEPIKLLVEEEGVPKNPTRKMCFQLAEEALEYKIKHHLIKYDGDGRYKLPEKLSHDEVGALALLMYDFAHIVTVPSALNENSIFAIYEAHGPLKGLYRTNSDYIRGVLHALEPKQTNTDIQNAYGFIARSTEEHQKGVTREAHLIPVNNGIYNKETGTLIAFSPQYTFLNKIPVDYNPYAVNPVINDHGYTWDVDSWLDDLLNTPEERKLMWEVISDTVQVNKNRKKSIWFYANKGNNGKGTVGQLIKNLHGAGNYSSLNVAAFADRFAKVSLLTANCNIADENNVNEYIDQVDEYKASITGDDITIDRKFEKPLTIQFHGTNIQMMNGLPRVKDKTDSFTRRLIIVPFLKCFTNNGERTEIKRDYVGRPEVLEYVLKKALQMNFEEFTVPETSKELLSKFEEDNNPVKQFWNNFKDDFQWSLLPSDFLYELYGNWYKDVNPSGGRLGKNNFLEEFAQVTEGVLEDARQKKVRSNGKMDGDEPLITDYNIRSYQVHGNTFEDQRNFERQKSYRGFVFI